MLESFSSYETQQADIKRLSQNLMSQRRHYFGPASRSDDESYPKIDTARRSDAEVGPKECRLRWPGKSLSAALSGLNVSIADTLRPSALHPGFFLAIAGSLGFEIASKETPWPMR
jgi:hypothetical protein